MKKYAKITAIALSVVSACSVAACALSACGDDTSVKRTVDNFDEWYDALCDTIASRNYTLTADCSDTEQNISHQLLTINRAGKYSVVSVDDTPVSYFEFGDNTVSEYITRYGLDESQTFWYKNEETFGSSFAEKTYINIFYGLYDEFTLERVSVFYGFQGPNTEGLTEETMRERAEVYYEMFTYDEDTNEYRLDFSPVSEVAESLSYTLKFANGKIETLKIDSTSQSWNHPGETRVTNVVHKFTYGNAKASVPSEVTAGAARTATLKGIAESLAGTYICSPVPAQAESQYTLVLDYSGNFDIVTGYGHFVISSELNTENFKYEVKSETEVIFIMTGSEETEPHSLTIGENCLIYKDQGGQEYSFQKTAVE